MLPEQVPDVSLMCMVVFAGLFLGGLSSYLANLLLHSEGLISYPSTGKSCGHKGKLFDSIPFLPFVLVSHDCKYCQRRVKWQYLLAEIVLAIAFVLLVKEFGLRFYTYGMMFYVTILLAVCVTDFRTKIIPHEITYPSIIAGIIFTSLTNASVLGALTGIGISYILFDFLAFYGLQIYIWVNKPTLAPSQQFVSMDKQVPVVRKSQRVASWLSAENLSLRFSRGQKESVTSRLYCKGMPIEELEIIGGGDAVLSALIAAWLGWQKLIFALVTGFLVGSLMGAIYILIELVKERMLKALIVPVISCVFILCFLAACMLWMLAASLNQTFLNMPYLYILPVAALAGVLLGVIIAGSKISKPFPFGPALAIGGFVAIFQKPF